MKIQLEIQDLKVHYSNKKKLGPYNMTFDRNPVGLIGANGAGKSTLLNALTGRIPFSSGKILFNDKAILPENRKWKAKIGFVPEIGVFNEYLSIEENILFSGFLFGIKESLLIQRTDALLSLLDLTEVKDMLVCHGSQGMRKKTLWAMALIHNPSLIILDEAFTSLDMIAIGRLCHVLTEMGKKGTLVILSTHILPIAELLCQKMIVLKDGQCFRETYKEDFAQSGVSLEEYSLLGLSKSEEIKKTEEFLSCL